MKFPKLSKAIFSLACLSGFSLSSLAAEEPPPNVLLIISDDQSWTDYGFMGHPVIETPRLDQLAKESLLFPRGYVPTSLCNPSLVSIITGLPPHQHKITGNEPPRPKGVPGRKVFQDPGYRAECEAMDDYIEKVPTLPRELAKKNYRSLQTGKWWQGNYSRGGFTHGMTHGDPDRGGRHGDEGLKIGREGLEPVYDFIEESQKAEKPFFIWYAPFLPHTPHNPPERLLNKYRDLAPTVPIAKYWAMCEWFDETCGALLDHLEENNLTQDTLVLYVTDNGWINQQNASRYAPRSKRSQYDGGIRTPVMARFPGKIDPQVINTPVSSLDLAPTILEFAGLSVPCGMKGINLTDNEALQKRDTVYGDIYLHNAIDIHDPSKNLKWRWMVQGDWKVILPNPEVQANDIPELYHITLDPYEKINLYEKRPEVAKQLTQDLNDWWTP